MNLINIQNNILRRTLLVAYAILGYVPEYLLYLLYTSIKSLVLNFNNVNYYTRNTIHPAMATVWNGIQTNNTADNEPTNNDTCCQD